LIDAPTHKMLYLYHKYIRSNGQICIFTSRPLVAKIGVRLKIEWRCAQSRISLRQDHHCILMSVGVNLRNISNSTCICHNHTIFYWNDNGCGVTENNVNSNSFFHGGFHWSQGATEDRLWFHLLNVYKIVDFYPIQDRINAWWSTSAELRIRCLGDHRY
jgi:hypothetical protein